MTLSQDATQPLDPIIQGSLDPAIKSSIPGFNITGYAAIGGQPGCCGNSPLTKSSGVWDISDNVSKIIGRHQLKFGIDYLIIRPTTASALGGRGSFGFNGVFTQNPQSRTGNGSGVADLLLGLANTANTGTVASVVERGHYAGGYFQDDWSVTSRLTLNLGLRYEFFQPFTEVDNRMANFIIDSGDPYYGQLAIAGLADKPRSLLYSHKNNWAPRVGFAYRIPGVKDLVLRGSYGIFYAQDQGTGITNRMTSNPPFYGYGGIALISDQTQPSTAFALSQDASLPRPAPVSPRDFILVPSATTPLVSWNQQALTPYVQEWNFTVEKQLSVGHGVVNKLCGKFRHAHLGAFGRKSAVDKRAGVTEYSAAAQFTHGSIKRLAPWDRSNYEGISSRVEKRFGSGVAFLGSFTYGKAIDLQNPALDLVDSSGGGDTVQNGYNLNANRAVGDGNVPLRFVLSGIWDLPFGKGKRLLNSGWGAALAGRWQLSEIFQMQSGVPFTPVLSFDNANAGTTSRPNRVCSGALDNPSPQAYFDVGCFVTPTQYTFGNSGRNILYGPGQTELDFGVHRSFAIPRWEAAQLEFRAEAFNAANHPQLSVPNATIGTANAGTISSTAAPNRELQFALRLSF